jgi:FHA domain
VVVETRYAAGDGVLLGAGNHWVLVTDPQNDDVLDQIWDVISGARATDAPVTEQVLAIVEKAFGGEPPGLAIVDLAHGGSTSISRGHGHVRVSGADRILSLDGGADPVAVPRLRRLAGGVVAASRATLKPLAHRTAPPPAHVSTPPPAGGLLIDGIPESILSATGPDGPPARPRRRASAEPGYDTGSQNDTTEPEAGFVERISAGTHTTIHPPSTDDAGPLAADDPADDHDGSTVHRPELASHLRHSTNDTVLAVSCPVGHLTPADSKVCRVCRQPVAPQEPRRVPRPTLGGLRLPTGEVVPLDRGVVLGRKPAPLEGSTDWPHLVHLPSDHTFVSRMHLHIELDGWNVLARDLDSRGGTMLTMPGRDPERMRAGEAYVLDPGCSLDLAEVYEVRFEVGPVVPR